MTGNVQNIDTGLRVLRILKILSSKDASMDELFEDLYKYSRKDCSYETVQKYINTLKYAGLEIIKNPKNGKLSLLNQPCKFELNQEDIETLAFLEVYVSSLHNPKLSFQFGEFLNKISKYFSQEQKKQYEIIKNAQKGCLKYDYSRLGILTHIFEEFCRDKLKVELEYKDENENRKTFVVEPKEIIYEKNMVYLLGYCAELSSNKKFLIDDIMSYRQLPNKVNNGAFLNTTVFECRGRLAKNYKLKESERIINSSDDCVIVSNAKEDKDLLLKRILKYGENAKIVQPKSLKLEMINVIDKMIENLQEDNNEKNSDSTNR